MKRATRTIFVRAIAVGMIIAFISANERVNATVSVSPANTFPGVPYVSYDVVTYVATQESPYFMGWSLSMIEWGFTQPSSSSAPPGSSIGMRGGSGNVNQQQMNWYPYSYIQDNVWYAYHIMANPSDGSAAIHGYSGAVQYHPGGN